MKARPLTWPLLMALTFPATADAAAPAEPPPNAPAGVEWNVTEGRFTLERMPRLARDATAPPVPFALSLSP